MQHFAYFFLFLREKIIQGWFHGSNPEPKLFKLLMEAALNPCASYFIHHWKRIVCDAM